MIFFVSIGGKLPKNAGIKIPTWRTWGILKQQGKSVPSCFKEAIHVSHRGTVHDQRYVSQRGFALARLRAAPDGTARRSGRLSQHRAWRWNRPHASRSRVKL